MKQLFSILFFIASYTAFTQVSVPSASSECAVTPPANYLKWRNALLQNNTNTLKHDICVNKQFSVVFYAIADSNGNANVSQASLNGCIASLNSVWKRICVSFVNCGLVVIPHHPYNRWTSDTIEPAVRANWYTDATINVYLPDSIVGPAAGYASMPGGPGNEVVVIEKGAWGVAIHEFGHFFGLPHTFDEIGPPATPGPPGLISTNEFVRRVPTNCYANGDGFCDTEADPYRVGKDNSAPCGFLPGPVDGYGDYYVPPVDNIMSYWGCSCRFTQEQYNMMATIALTTLAYLH